MPATLSQLRRPHLIDHTVDFGEGVTVTFRYDRNKITDSWVQESEALDMNAVLADLIESWDVTADDGSGFPPTPANIGFVFTLADKSHVLGELMGAAVPARAEGNASPAPSSTPPSDSTEPQPTFLNGQATSPLPVSLASPSLT